MKQGNYGKSVWITNPVLNPLKTLTTRKNPVKNVSGILGSHFYLPFFGTMLWSPVEADGLAPALVQMSQQMIPHRPGGHERFLTH